MCVSCSCQSFNLQTQLVQGMAELGEHALAEEFRKQLALPPSTLAPPDPGEAAGKKSSRELQAACCSQVPCESSQPVAALWRVSADGSWTSQLLRATGSTSKAKGLMGSPQRGVILLDAQGPCVLVTCCSCAKQLAVLRGHSDGWCSTLPLIDNVTKSASVICCLSLQL